MRISLEHVARAIITARLGRPNDQACKLYVDDAWPTFIDEARAALEAIRFPCPEMLEAGCTAHPMGGYHRATMLNDIIEAEYMAMIDNILEQELIYP